MIPQPRRCRTGPSNLAAIEKAGVAAARNAGVAAYADRLGLLSR